jgi:hypothetical protein
LQTSFAATKIRRRRQDDHQPERPQHYANETHRNGWAERRGLFWKPFGIRGLSRGLNMTGAEFPHRKALRSPVNLSSLM